MSLSATFMYAAIAGAASGSARARSSALIREARSVIVGHHERVSLRNAIPAFPARDVAATVAFYRDRLGFEVAYQHEGFARLVRDDVELHLWESGDDGWRSRADFTDNPVCSGAETFIAGTSSCRVLVDDVDGLYDEMRSRRGAALPGSRISDRHRLRYPGVRDHRSGRQPDRVLPAARLS